VRPQPCLLKEPTRRPLTNQEFGDKLRYIDNINTRNLLTLYLGDDAYQRHDDSDSEWRYNTNIALCEELAGLLNGMNRRQIDYQAAQRMVMNEDQENAILVGFNVLLLHPESFEPSKLHLWERAEVLGLSAEADAGNVWAQWLKGQFSIDVKDYDLARYYF